ncbi:hypothetical protein ANN_08169 [Periplaneta americana]|uniref:Uncharacterized protein n=1 Tax=Periplaneta americana TaxID=6978 RepID=A0ABQ8T0M2_PERAM|nr:hypothetical protein ANN_08169 [Periplaneta americana]
MAGLCEGGNEPPGSLKAKSVLSADYFKRNSQLENLKKKTFGRPRRRREDNIKVDLRKVRHDARNWINLAQDRDQRWSYVREAMDIRVL